MFTDNEKLVKNNSDYNMLKKLKNNIRFDGKRLQIQFTVSWFGGYEIRCLLIVLNHYLKRYGKKLSYLYIKFENIQPIDKLSYIMLEIILYLTEKKYGIEFNITGTCKANINTHGFYNSIITTWGKSPNKVNFVNLFERKNRITENGFRRNISCDNLTEISFLMSEVKSFLKRFDISNKDRGKIAKVVCELADNACEHAQNDCLVDIDVSLNYEKKDDNGFYYSVNICVLNFSDILLGEKVKNKILHLDSNIIKSSRYKNLVKGYYNHQSFFNNYYTEDHFFMIASFQNEISGRDFETNTGGKGLTEIVKEIENTATVYSCYMLSGNKGISFIPETLEIDTEGWISFNREGDFINIRPDNDVIIQSDTFIPGTAYNLSLVYKRSEIYDN